MKYYSIKELKQYLKDLYKALSITENYTQEETIDKHIHNVKKELDSRGVYVIENIKPKFISRKQ